MAEPKHEPDDVAIEVGDALQPELAQQLSESFLRSLAELGFTVVRDSVSRSSPDLLIEDEEGHTLAVEVKVKTPRHRHSKDVQDTLVEIRERNQIASERLAKLKQRLANA